MNIFKLFSDSKKSKDVAKERLQFILFSDRASISPDIVEALKEDLLKVISKYVEIDDNYLDVSLTNVEEGRESRAALVANIPIKRVR